MGNDLTLFRIQGLVKRATQIVDKALIIEREVGMENIYTLLALGKPLEEIGEALGLSPMETELTLCRTTEHRSRFILAKMFPVARNSVEQMGRVGDTMTSEQRNAMQYHSSIVDMFMRYTAKSQDASTGVTVNNTIVVNDKHDIPELPIELEGEYADFEPQS